MNAPALDISKLEEITERDPIALNMMDYIIDRKRSDTKISISTLKREIEITLKKQISNDDMMATLKKLASTNAIGISKLQNLIKFRIDPKKLAKMALGEYKTELQEKKQAERLKEVKQRISKGEVGMAATQTNLLANQNEDLINLATSSETALALFTDLAGIKRPKVISDISQRFTIIKKKYPDASHHEYNEVYNKLSEMGYCIVIYGTFTTTKDRVFWKVRQDDLGRVALGENIAISKRNTIDVEAAVKIYTRDMVGKIKTPQGMFSAVHENAVKRAEANTSLNKPIVEDKPVPQLSRHTVDHHAVTVEIPISADFGEVLKWIETGKQSLNLRINLK